MIIHTHANSKYLGWIRYWCIGCDDALDEAIKTFKTDSAHMGGKRGVTFWPFINSKLELTI